MLNNITVCLNNIKSEKNAEEQQQEQGHNFKRCRCVSSLSLHLKSFHNFTYLVYLSHLLALFFSYLPDLRDHHDLCLHDHYDHVLKAFKNRNKTEKV